MSLPYDATSILQRDGADIIGAAHRMGLDVDVPSCDGWTMGDLIWHMSGVWTFWRFIVKNDVTTEEELSKYPEIPRVADGMLLDWASTALNGLHAVLTSTPPHKEVWTWAGNADVWWIRRRMCQETAVHRWDSEQVTGDPYEIWSLVAADGIDEFLNVFTPRQRKEPLPGTVHLHCTDTSAEENGEWMIHSLDEGSIDVERTHAKGDAAIRGTANDLLLWLWGRDAGPVEILGDRALAANLRLGYDGA
jgi:uncharacterized protein (TIGR03083 family)